MRRRTPRTRGDLSLQRRLVYLRVAFGAILVASPDAVLSWGIPDFQYAGWRDQAAIFDGIAASAGRQFTITGDGEPEQLKAQIVTPGFLGALGVSPIVGRDFADTEAALRGGQVALLSHDLWTRRFGADPSILSRSISLDGKPYSVAGVLPPDGIR